MTTLPYRYGARVDPESEEYDLEFAALWPLDRGETVTFHEEGCPVEVDDDCACQPLRVRGPTARA